MDNTLPEPVIIETERMILQPYCDGTYFLESKSGEGIQVWPKDLDEALYNLFLDKF